ncbi:MAG: formylglycine-generating enzyme family protein [Planctomycetota bacterium]
MFQALFTAVLLLAPTTQPTAAPAGMVHVPAGTVLIGDDATMPEERPQHAVTVGAIFVDVTEVTNDQYAAFVEATGYVTVAERVPDPADFPGADPAALVPGSVVFTPPPAGTNPRHWRQWWSWVPGASWKHPEGPGSDLVGRGDHPVVHVAFEDAQAFAEWAGKRLPTEAEWEAAARGGLVGKRYTWGDEQRPDGVVLANHWQGNFPIENTNDDGFLGLAPVGQFPANGFGLREMAGNAWEWTDTPWTPDHRPDAPRDSSAAVLKGGSFLCADNYCYRYRPAARTNGARDTGSSHVSFRCVIDAPAQ